MPKKKKKKTEALPTLVDFCGENKYDRPTNAGFQYWFKNVDGKEKDGTSGNTGSERMTTEDWLKKMKKWLNTPITD